MGRLLEIAKAAAPEPETIVPYVSAVRRPESTSVTYLPVSDAYAERMRKALDSLCTPTYPGGMIAWLDSAYPDFYAELTSRLPDEIQQLWSERAPLEQFESVLVRLLTLHKQCCDLYRVAQYGQAGKRVL
jgi:hypothetical protein